ncbi:MAG TPA: tetratricopeptide repeat protein [Burkholderiales bacterium]|jgi:regulator of sirC expression with transglutaminase-like and TPR domain|nr:tetratricopeptide repeat protein [Burkholderiales bacterium]
MMSHAERFRQVVCGPDEAINLGEAALLIAAEEYRDLDIASYLARLDQLAATLKRRLRPDIGSADTIVALNRFLFEEHGFSGDAADYYDPRNSFLNEVLDRKRGIPITLAVVYIEIGRRIGLPVQGISFPAHFLVKCPLREGTVVLDPYAKGISLSFDDLKQRIKNLRKGVEPSRSVVAGALATASNKDILVRMLRNLKGIYSHHKEWLKALAAVDRIIIAMPNSAEEYRDRGMFYANLECFRAALFDLQAYLKMLPVAQDADVVREKVIELQAVASRLN